MHLYDEIRSSIVGLSFFCTIGLVAAGSQTIILEGNYPTALRTIMVNDEGAWIGTREAAANMPEGFAKRFTAKDDTAGKFIYLEGLAHAPNGDVWISYWGGIARIRNEEIVRFDHSDYPEVGEWYNWDIAVDSSGTVWVAEHGYGGRLLKYKDDKFTTYDICSRQSCKEFHGRAVAVDSSQKVWFGSITGGLYHVEDSILVRDSIPPDTVEVTLNDSIHTMVTNDMSIMCLTVDSGGRLWVGHDDNYVSVLENGTWKNYYIRTNADFFHPVRAVKTDSTGTVWAVSQQNVMPGYVNYLNDTGWVQSDSTEWPFLSIQEEVNRLFGVPVQFTTSDRGKQIAGICINIQPSRVAFNCSLNSALPVDVSIHDLQGRVVSQLSETDRGTFSWDKRSTAGNRASSGTYVVRHRTANEHLSRSFVLTE